jgi:OOP family OmpA-OmpF porin
VRGRRRGGLVPWLISLALVPVLVVAVVVAVAKNGIEQDLTGRSAAALRAADFAGIGVRFDGRDATLTGVPAGSEAKAAGAVKSVAGVRVAELSRGATAAGSANRVDLALRGDTVVVAGTVPDEGARRQLVDAVRSTAGNRTIEDQVTVTAGGPGLNLGPVRALADLLATGAGDRAVSYDGRTVSLTGAVPSEAARSTAADAASAAAPGATVENQLTLGAPNDSAAAQLQAKIKAILEDAPIRFSIGSHQLSETGARSVRKIAALLAKQPTVRVLAAGHTDNQGDKSISQPLSERRAQTVKSALVAAGVAANRIDVIGHGESRPTASNATPAGLAANRRVELRVLTGGAS